MVPGLSLEDMSADDAPIVNSWFRHDEASADTAWSPPGFRVDDELSQHDPAKSLKRADRRDQTVELLSAYAWVVRPPGTQAPMGWASGEVWPCHDFDSHIVEGRIPDDADALPFATFQLAVAPSYRGRGYGTAIVATIAADPRLRSTQIWLGIDVKNGASRTAAVRAGFGSGRVRQLVVAEVGGVVVACVAHHAVDLDFHRPQPGRRRSLGGAFVAAAQRFSILADTFFGRDAAGAPPTAGAAVLGHVWSGSGTGAHASPCLRRHSMPTRGIELPRAPGRTLAISVTEPAWARRLRREG